MIELGKASETTRARFVTKNVWDGVKVEDSPGSGLLYSKSDFAEPAGKNFFPG
jgi:hypothetical protein